jgi:hypothetical protein
MAKTDSAPPADRPDKVAAPERVAAFRTGISAESRAAAFLMAKGYRILAKVSAPLTARSISSRSAATSSPLSR